MIALDTNVVADLIRRRDMVRRNYDDALEAGVPMVISVVVLQELLFGAEMHPRPEQEHARLKALLMDFEVIPFETPDAAVGGSIRARMEKSGRRAPAGDFIVGVHALARGCTLVTANTRHFEHIPGLKLLNWRQPPEDLQEPAHV